MSSPNSGGINNAGSNNGSLGDEGVTAARRDEQEHLNIKVTDNNNEIFFKIKRTTKLKKLMDAFCERQGKVRESVRFYFDGIRVTDEHTPNTVWSCACVILFLKIISKAADSNLGSLRWKMETLLTFIWNSRVDHSSVSESLVVR